MAYQQIPPQEGLDALLRFIQGLVSIFGPWGTLLIAALILAAFAVRRYYNDYQKGKEVNQALAEKDKTIQRLAQQEREWRILFFKEKAGWTDEQVKQFVQENVFKDEVEARKALEGPKGEEIDGPLAALKNKK